MADVYPMTLKILGSMGALMALFALGATPAFAESKPMFLGTGATVMIGADGNVLVRGAEISSVGSGSMTETTKWNDTELTWTIDTDSDTDLIGRDREEAEHNDFDIGDLISFAGSLSGSLVVDADTVREWPDKDDARKPDERKERKEHTGAKREFHFPFVGFWNSFKARF
jgi:hypothetical protein